MIKLKIQSVNISQNKPRNTKISAKMLQSRLELGGVFAIVATCLLAAINFTEAQQAIGSANTNGAGQYFYPSVSRTGEFLAPPISNIFYNGSEMSLMYPYDRSDLTEISSGKPIHDQPLQFRLPFFGFSYEYIWIQRDGYITFNKGLQTYVFPLKLPIQPSDTFVQEDPAFLAPLFAMQDITPDIAQSGVYFRIINMADPTRGFYDPNYEGRLALRDRILFDFKTGMIGASDFVPKWAMIVTWCNMTIANRRTERPLKTNTFQAVIATDEIRTYAMFNYEQIEWITHLDNYDGLKGYAAFVGFNAGNTTRSFEFKPYSQHQRVSMLPSGGFGNNLRGRYYFQVDEEVWPGSCIDKKLEPNLRDRLPLTFFPRYGHMLGGTLVDVTGPCLDPSSIIFCRFDNFRSEAVFRGTNRATCISPPFMYHGYVDLTISVDDRIEFVGRFYIQPPEVADDDVVVLDGKDREEAPDELELKWRPQKLFWGNDSRVTVSLWGYREAMNVYPTLTYITTLSQGISLGRAQYKLDLSQFRDRDDPETRDILFGFIAVNLTNPSVLDVRMRHSPTIWSRPMPLSWYFRPQWIRTIGWSYKDYFCKNWHERESFADRFAATVWRCPCTLAQVNVDRGRFSPDLQCNIIDRRCDTFHREALHCVNTGRPSIGGSGQTCCYDDQGELIQTADTIYGGRPSRAFIYGKHPFKIRMMIPSLSSWVHDVAPIFYCCLWQKKKDNADSCQNYNALRTSQDCSLYQAPVVGSVYGDPHMVTFNKNNYTFNGKGEYVLVHSDDPKVKFDVQARFEQVPRQFRHMAPIKATQLTAVAAQDNFSSIVEFRIRPLAARWRYHIYVLVDNEYIFWWDKSMQVQNFRGVTLYQPAGIQNMSHIIAMFDSGAGVEVQSIDGFLTTHVYLPADFQSITGGLLGNYSRFGNSIDDLVTPNGMRFSGRQQLPELHRFGQQWRLTESEQPRIGKTLFSHSAVRYALYDDQKFQPEFDLNNYEMSYFDSAERAAEIASICSDSSSCIYDYKVSYGNKELALSTKRFEAIAFELAYSASENIIRCPALPKPANGMKSENRYWPGKVVRFSCDAGYRLVGYEARYCRPDGLWSWGEEPECISEWRYFFIMIGSVLAAFVPMAVTIAAGVFCIVFMVRRSRAHYTGETGLKRAPVFREKAASNSNLAARTAANQNDTGLELDESQPFQGGVRDRRSGGATGASSARPSSAARFRQQQQQPTGALRQPDGPTEVDLGDDSSDDQADDSELELELENPDNYNETNQRAPRAQPEMDDDFDSGDDNDDGRRQAAGSASDRLLRQANSARQLGRRSIFDEPAAGGLASGVYMPTTTTGGSRFEPAARAGSGSARMFGEPRDSQRRQTSSVGLPIRPKPSTRNEPDFGPIREARI